MVKYVETIALPFGIEKACLALQIEPRLENIFAMGINCMSLAVWLGAGRNVL